MKILTQPFHDHHKMTTEGVRTRDAHLISEFVSSERVSSAVILNRPLSLAEAVGKQRLAEIGPRGFLRPQVSRSVPRLGMEVVQITLPHLGRPLLERRDYWATSLATGFAQGVIEHLMSERVDVVLLSNPLAYPVLSAVPAGVVVAFDAIDDWLNHPEMSDRSGKIAEGYRRILGRADVVVTNSEEMQERLCTRGARDPILLRNGVKSSWLNYPAWKRPPGDQVTLGYAGKLAKRIDVSTLTLLAKSHPEWTIELAGPITNREWMAPLRGVRNIRWLGDVPHDELPELFRGWNVALIPHNVGELENGGHPIKLYEYLSCGIPVVSTPISGIGALGDWPIVADPGRSFLDSVHVALGHAESSVAKIEGRRDAVRSWTWTRTADEFLDYLEMAKRKVTNG